ncbi:shikimate kinase [Litorimonas taeanensis]|nr:shikimate kinase [Litorimonas taeanensis]
MSNIGKSYTASRLAKSYNFELIEIDQLIQDEMGHSDMEAFAQWQGQPYSEGYAKREMESTALETRALEKAMNAEGSNIILDTPGSVIYTGEKTLKALQSTHYIVYISASDERVEGLKKQYFANPKPLIWREHYQKASHQSNEEAILTSFPKLLTARARTYEDLADITLPSEFILDAKNQVSDIFDFLKPAI